VAIFNRVITLLDEAAPAGGAFAHAADWAGRLGCSLRLMVPPGQQLSHDTGETRSSVDPVDACVEKAKALRLRCELVPRAGSPSRADTEAGAADLLVLRAQTPLVPVCLAQTENVPAMLVCPAVWSPPSRFLLVDDGQPEADCYIRQALELCRQLRVIPILLTWAPSERAARQRQNKFRRLLDVGAVAVCDTMVGGDVRAAVGGVARWRKCQSVVTQRGPANRWFRWLRTSMPEQLLDLADSLALLALPGADIQDASPPAGDKPAAAGVFSMPSNVLDCAKPVK
jgi:hypothetical protein